MDTDNYENPFASSDKEIGQMDVQIEEEDVLRESIRRIILESQLGFQCNNHSLGFVDAKGEWINCEGMPHGEWLYRNYYDDIVPEGGITIPLNWIKVSNASQIFFGGNSWEDVTPEQIQGLIDMWGDCNKYSRWIQNETETFEVIFGLIAPNRRMSNLEEMTIPDFLGLYGGRKAVDKFYGMLLGEL